jgi:glycosyltransferase involved in cell wall biosynthesis
VSDGRRVLHVISGLGTGGAETMLLRLAAATDRARYKPSVLTLRGGPMAGELRAQGIDVADARLGAFRIPQALRAITRHARECRPHVIQGWMNHGNLAAWHAARALPKRPVLIWGIRQSLYDVHLEKLATRVIIRAEAHLSAAPDAILYNSSLAVEQHRAAGFRNARMQVIPNGLDTAVFRADEAVRSAGRAELGIDAGADVVGIVGRAHSMKDFPTYFAAMARVLQARPRARVLAVGLGVPELAPLVLQTMDAALAARVLLLPERRHLQNLYPVFDVLCSTSLHGEGFPNVVAEAMACEVPCVVTDVGDAATVAGDSGLVVPRSDARAVADAVLTLLELDPVARAKRGREARAHIANRFSIGSIADRYQHLYDSLLENDEQHS